MNTSVWARVLRTFLVVLVLVACGAGDDAEHLGSSRLKIGVNQPLVIRQVYNGWAPSATYGRIFIEIYNRGTTPASLANLTLQGPGLGQTTGAFSAIASLPAVTLAPRTIIPGGDPVRRGRA